MKRPAMRRLIAFVVAVAALSEPAAAATLRTAITLYDPARNRPVPVVLYRAEDASGPQPLAVVSPGHGASATSYSFISEALVQRGYTVAAVQNEIPGDPPLILGDDIFNRRMPGWRAAAGSLDLIVRTVREAGLANSQPLLLVGHSNGGDISLLYAAEHPKDVAVAVTLDNRRYPLPRRPSPHVCTIRSVDQPPDPGVLPTPEEQKINGTVIETIPGLGHNDMADWATPVWREGMLRVILGCAEARAQPKTQAGIGNSP
ncbi:serine aminopeptidase domain-containing protein [Phenylobacterium deserti]|uniref:Alpha/beta hydrolase n=1 Tax=Phenylobacterium deserti TaxID=1914756 RepID=A0A328AVA1_9CAUL|nr:alpha/beta hydrolase [Phenylobacterium deserti]RAK57646.1 alpha/beta hydrolase [Phenylobacterium deserti]